MSWTTAKAQKKRKVTQDAVLNLQQDNKLLFSMLIMEFFGMGIAPVFNVNDNMNISLAPMGQEEADKMRRKFRKVWHRVIDTLVRESNARRRTARKDPKQSHFKSLKRKDLKCDAASPTRQTMKRRKSFVRGVAYKRAYEIVQRIHQMGYSGTNKEGEP